MTDKDDTVYVPLLNAFKDELQRAYEQDKTIPKRLISYLESEISIRLWLSTRNAQPSFREFNLRGELNKDGKQTKAAIIIPVAELPTEIVAIRFKTDSTNTVELYLNNGWSLSFRIHNASTTVEPSLKFDIQFIGVPSNIITINCIWK